MPSNCDIQQPQSNIALQLFKLTFIIIQQIFKITQKDTCIPNYKKDLHNHSKRYIMFKCCLFKIILSMFLFQNFLISHARSYLICCGVSQMSFQFFFPTEQVRNFLWNAPTRVHWRLHDSSTLVSKTREMLNNVKLKVTSFRVILLSHKKCPKFC